MAIEAWAAAWPQSAADLLTHAKGASASNGELVRLVMAGIRRLDSWLIENRVLPALADRHVKVLRFSLAVPHHELRTAAIVPLPDGSAFACSASGRWSDLDPQEALAAIQYIGYRYASGDHWVRDFQATVHSPGEPPVPVAPSAAADLWKEITGIRPHGFEHSVFDQVQAFGLNILDKAFNTQGRLGL